MEKTLVLIKPDAVEKNIIGKVISHYEDNGLKIVEMKMLTATKELAEEHYIEHADKPFYNSIVSFITRSPIVAMIVEGDNAIEKVRKINGPTKPVGADPNSIRGKYSTDVEENCVHASDSPEGAEKEINLWFGNLA